MRPFVRMALLAGAAYLVRRYWQSGLRASAAGHRPLPMTPEPRTS